jgi:hypothetical protein
MYIYDNWSLNFSWNENTSEKMQRNSKHAFYIYIYIYRKLCRYEIMWKNIINPDRPYLAIWRMYIACLITKTTDTHSEYVIHVAFCKATIVTRTRLKVTLHVHRMACLSVVVQCLTEWHSDSSSWDWKKSFLLCCRSAYIAGDLTFGVDRD